MQLLLGLAATRLIAGRVQKFPVIFPASREFADAPTVSRRSTTCVDSQRVEFIDENGGSNQHDLTVAGQTDVLTVRRGFLSLSSGRAPRHAESDYRTTERRHTGPPKHKTETDFEANTPVERMRHHHDVMTAPPGWPRFGFVEGNNGYVYELRSRSKLAVTALRGLPRRTDQLSEHRPAKFSGYTASRARFIPPCTLPAGKRLNISEAYGVALLLHGAERLAVAVVQPLFFLRRVLCLHPR